MAGTIRQTCYADLIEVEIVRAGINKTGVYLFILKKKGGDVFWLLLVFVLGFSAITCRFRITGRKAPDQKKKNGIIMYVIFFISQLKI